ncbi:Uncharacterised protein [Clostridium putrefaciens]|uniref:Uncharacterized protein n=1 Tax=Clostridium putrefaciens TaxID=99675 RepID=A0A381JA10_9CLOT|nr:Uncharacterised protein [Clostridium putrefaciens]
MEIISNNYLTILHNVLKYSKRIGVTIRCRKD